MEHRHRACYVPLTVVAAWDNSVTKTKISDVMKHTSQRRGITNTQHFKKAVQHIGELWKEKGEWNRGIGVQAMGMDDVALGRQIEKGTALVLATFQ